MNHKPHQPSLQKQTKKYDQFLRNAAITLKITGHNTFDESPFLRTLSPSRGQFMATANSCAEPQNKDSSRGPYAIDHLPSSTLTHTHTKQRGEVCLDTRWRSSPKVVGEGWFGAGASWSFHFDRLLRVRHPSRSIQARERRSWAVLPNINGTVWTFYLASVVVVVG